MNDSEYNDDIRRLIEDFGILYGKWGLPRMVGRILGWLLICDPPHQTAAQLAEAVGASKGSISTSVHMLEKSLLVEKIGIPGERSLFYRIRRESWAELMKAKIGAMIEMRKLAERGLAIIPLENEELRTRLTEMRDFYKFFELALPAIIERYEIERGR